MKPMTEEQSKAYKAYRQSGGTATMRAWMEEQSRGGRPTARARGVNPSGVLPWSQRQPPRTGPGPYSPPQIAGDVPPKPVHGVDPVEPADPPGGRIDPVGPATAKASAGGASVGAAGENSGTQADESSGGKPGGKPASQSESSGGKPGGKPAEASTTAPVDQGAGNDAQTAQIAQVQQRAALWQRRMAELEQAVINGQASHTDFMREQQRFEAFMAAAESGDYAGAMAAQNPFDGGSGANAAPRRDLDQINAERARNGLRPLTQDVYEVMPERGAQQAARSYGDQGGQILSNEYASESQMSSAPRMSQIIAGAGGDPAEIQRRMQAMGSTSVIDDVSGMTAEQIAGNRYGAAIEEWRRQNAPQAPASGGKPGGPAPASAGAAKMGDPTPLPVTVGGSSGVQTGGGFGAAQEVAPVGGQIVQPPVETRPQAPREINPVGGPKPATGGPRPAPPNYGIGQQPVGGGPVRPGGATEDVPKPIGTDPMEPPSSGVGGVTGTRPIGGQIVRPPDPRQQGRASYMEMRNGMAGKPPPELITPTQPPSVKMPGSTATSAADIMRNAAAGVGGGIKSVGSAIGGGLRSVGNALSSGAGAIGSAVGGGLAALQNGSNNPSATPANAAANITGSPQSPSGGRSGNVDVNPGGGLTQTGMAAFNGARIEQNQQRTREQAIQTMQSFRGMR